MILPKIRRESEALKRKFASELSAYFLRPPALGFCDELTEAVVRSKSDSAMSLFEWARIFFKRWTGRGFLSLEVDGTPVQMRLLWPSTLAPCQTLPPSLR